MLQDGPATAPLGTAEDFLASDHDVPRVAPTEAQKCPFSFGKRLAAEGRADSPLR